MEELNVHFEELPSMRVATASAFGPSPEMVAWAKLAGWAKDKGINLESARVFGFDNPPPSPGSPNYGYEVWLEVNPEVQGNEDILVQEFPGGFYAVTRVIGVNNIFPAWQKLVAWCEDSPYRIGGHQCLEGHVDLNLDNLEMLTLDLYLPIVKQAP